SRSPTPNSPQNQRRSYTRTYPRTGSPSSSPSPSPPPPPEPASSPHPSRAGVSPQSRHVPTRSMPKTRPVRRLSDDHPRTPSPASSRSSSWSSCPVRRRPGPVPLVLPVLGLVPLVVPVVLRPVLGVVGAVGGVVLGRVAGGCRVRRLPVPAHRAVPALHRGVHLDPSRPGRRLGRHPHL